MQTRQVFHSPSETSLIRVILVTQSDEEFLIYEVFPAVFESSTINNAYYETCYLNGIIPDFIKVKIIDASININSINIEDDFIENAILLQETEKLNIENSRIQLINNYIAENQLIWHSGMNPNLEMTYDEKRMLFNDREVPNLQGLEYYISGFFSIGIPSSGAHMKEGIIENFDWRSRHGANNPNSDYFDGDYVNWSGWIPDRFQQQVNNDCYGQAPTFTIEALTNLYFNNPELDIDLSQEDAINCSLDIPYGFTAANEWINLPTGFDNDLNAISLYEMDAGFAVGKDGIILHTTDKGNSWIAQSCPTSADLNSICFKAEKGFIIGDEGIILKTSNSGTDWTIQNSGTIEDLNSAFIISSNNDVCYIAGDAGTILKTTNGGSTWINQISGTVEDLNAIHFTKESNFNLGYAVGSNGTILKTLNGGIVWTAQNSGTVEDLNAIHFIEENGMFTGYTVGNGGTILKTTNGGINWTNQSSFYDENFKSVFLTAESIIYIVGDDGLILKSI
ncbi:MAG: YCF48-related protein [Bacteroidales bacterium]